MSLLNAQVYKFEFEEALTLGVPEKTQNETVVAAGGTDPLIFTVPVFVNGQPAPENRRVTWTLVGPLAKNGTLSVVQTQEHGYSGETEIIAGQSIITKTDETGHANVAVRSTQGGNLQLVATVENDADNINGFSDQDNTNSKRRVFTARFKQLVDQERSSVEFADYTENEYTRLADGVQYYDVRIDAKDAQGNSLANTKVSYAPIYSGDSLNWSRPDLKNIIIPASNAQPDGTYRTGPHGSLTLRFKSTKPGWFKIKAVIHNV